MKDSVSAASHLNVADTNVAKSCDDYDDNDDLHCDKHSQRHHDDHHDVKCSAVSTMERGMPDTDISELTDQLRTLILAEAEREPDKFRPSDVRRVRTDSWTSERYLLRNKLDVNAAFKMMKASFEFKASPEVNIGEFPVEFYQTGSVFSYERDRKNNVVLYLRCKVNQKIPLVLRFMKAFVVHNIELADLEANGRGIVVVFDIQGVGLSNVDMEFLYFFVSMLSRYFPKGISYFLIHELPWYLRSFLVAVRSWMSAEHRELLKCSTRDTVTEYIASENLPDFMGGSCKRDYRQVPKTAITLKQASINWQLDESELMVIRKKYEAYLPASAQDNKDEVDKENFTVEPAF